MVVDPWYREELAAMVLIGIEHGWLALAVGAATARRAPSIAVPGTIAVAGYVLYAMGAIVEAVEPWRVLSPFHQAQDGGPIGAGLPAAYAWMAVGAVAACRMRPELGYAPGPSYPSQGS